MSAVKKGSRKNNNVGQSWNLWSPLWRSDCFSHLINCVTYYQDLHERLDARHHRKSSVYLALGPKDCRKFLFEILQWFQTNLVWKQVWKKIFFKYMMLQVSDKLQYIVWPPAKPMSTVFLISTLWLGYSQSAPRKWMTLLDWRICWHQAIACQAVLLIVI